MTMPTFDQFRQAALDEGFDEVLVREGPPDHLVDSDRHPWDVKALVVRGDIVLTVGESPSHFKAGDPFTLAHDTLHTEQYGPEGATFWVGRKNPPIGS